MPNKEIWFPKKSHHGYYDKALNRYFSDKTEKREYMNEHKLVEDGSMESEKHRVNRLCEVINYEREKQGEKPKTKEEIIGDSRR